MRRPAFYELRPARASPTWSASAAASPPRPRPRSSTSSASCRRPARAPGLPDRTFVDVGARSGDRRRERPRPRPAARRRRRVGGRHPGQALGLGGGAGPRQAARPLRVHARPDGDSTCWRKAGGTWPDVLPDIAVIDRIDPLREHLHRDPAARRDPRRPPAGRRRCMERDELRVFSQGEMLDREQVTAAGVVREPGEFIYRRGMTLKDLLARAGGVPATADLSRVEVHRLRRDKVMSAARRGAAGRHRGRAQLRPAAGLDAGRRRRPPRAVRPPGGAATAVVRAPAQRDHPGRSALQRHPSPWSPRTRRSAPSSPAPAA